MRSAYEATWYCLQFIVPVTSVESVSTALPSAVLNIALGYSAVITPEFLCEVKFIVSRYYFSWRRFLY